MSVSVFVVAGLMLLEPFESNAHIHSPQLTEGAGADAGAGVAPQSTSVSAAIAAAMPVRVGVSAITAP